MAALKTSLDYLNHFPVLKTPLGYTLLIDDFTAKFPDLTGKSLHMVWPKIGSVVVDLLKAKGIQHEDLHSSLIDMHVQSVKLLPFLFVPPQIRTRTTKRVAKLSRTEMADRFFLQVPKTNFLTFFFILNIRYLSGSLNIWNLPLFKS
ncbi:hypothetical protein JTB14_020620 [Gonioctena quinquepunctata]|nr:hypothetical protein JTB14_020620 [Gonioctena quinquepunctata]